MYTHTDIHLRYTPPISLFLGFVLLSAKQMLDIAQTEVLAAYPGSGRALVM